MTILAPFCYDDRGRAYFAADGPELYAYSGVDDSPLWKDFAQGILVGLAISGDQVFGVDTDGRLVQWRLFDGAVARVTEHGVSCRAIATDPHGACALLTDYGVRVVAANGSYVDVNVPEASCVGRDASGGRVLVGTLQGSVLWVDPSSGQVLGQLHVGGPVRSIAWSSQGTWVVGAGSTLCSVSADGLEASVTGIVPVGGGIRDVSVSADGWLYAVIVDDTSVALFAVVGGEQLARVEYTRNVGQIAFGPDTWLGIALEYADTNRVELGTGRLTRNSPGLGRSSDPWRTDLKMDAARVRGALARSRAGGSPVAQQVERPKPGVYEEKKRPAWLIPAIVAGVISLVCGCSGCCGLFAYLR